MLKRTLSPLFVALWSSGYVVGALAVRVSGPLPLLEARFTLAALITVPLALRHGRWRGAPLRELVATGLLLQVMQFGGAYAGLSMGVPAGVSALVMLGLSPLVTTALAIRLGLERSSARRWLGLVVGALGVFVGLVPELAGTRIGLGLVFTCIGMLGLSGGAVVQKRYTADVDPRVSVAVQSITAAVVLAPALAVIGGHVHPGLHLYACVAWLGAGMAVISLLVLIRLLTTTSASHVSALLLLVPAVTALASAPALGEAIHPLTLVGMAIAALGVCAALTGGAPNGDVSRPRSVRGRARRAGASAPAR